MFLSLVFKAVRKIIGIPRNAYSNTREMADNITL